jgi:hypothetical protein
LPARLFTTQLFKQRISFFSIVFVLYIAKKNSQAFCFFSQGVDQIYEKMALMRIAAYCINIALHSHSPQDDAMLCQELTTGILTFCWLLCARIFYEMSWLKNTSNPQKLKT